MKRARVYYKCIDARRAFCIRRYARRRLLCVCMYASARDKYGFPARSPRDNDICYSISSARDGGSLAETDNFLFSVCALCITTRAPFTEPIGFVLFVHRNLCARIGPRTKSQTTTVHPTESTTEPTLGQRHQIARSRCVNKIIYDENTISEQNYSTNNIRRVPGNIRSSREKKSDFLHDSWS